MSTIRGVTARVAHPCEGHDQMTVNGAVSKSILPGQRYLRHTGFPGDEGGDGLVGPYSIAECATCAVRRDPDAALMYGICGSYCCGTNPCVLPFAPAGAPGHTCACERCYEDDQRELVAAGAGAREG